MGIINQGILGSVSGTVGTVVGSSWKGINYIRAKAANYSDANSERQIEVRGTFLKICRLAKRLSASVIKPIWNSKNMKMSGFNYFLKTNFYAVDPLLPLADCEDLVMSVGNLEPAANINIVDNAAVPGGVTVTWEDNSGFYDASPDDRLRIVAIHGDDAVALSNVGSIRSAGTASVLLPFGPGVSVRVFAFFENATRTMFSNDKSFLVEVS